MDPASLSDFLNAWGYPALLALLILTGIGSPIPEDLLLLSAGYLVFTGVFTVPVALLVCIIGVVVSDVMLYSIGRRFAMRTAAGGSGAPPPGRSSIARLVERFGPTGVLAARLLPGTRAVAFITAGVRALPIDQFVRYDLVGACLWVPLMLFAGHSVGEHVGGIEVIARVMGRGAIWIGAVAVVLLLLWIRWPRMESKL